MRLRNEREETGSADSYHGLPIFCVWGAGSPLRFTVSFPREGRVLLDASGGFPWAQDGLDLQRACFIAAGRVSLNGVLGASHSVRFQWPYG